jgi:hypothetical protein
MKSRILLFCALFVLISVYFDSMVIDLALSDLFNLNATNTLRRMTITQSKA